MPVRVREGCLAPLAFPGAGLTGESPPLLSLPLRSLHAVVTLTGAIVGAISVTASSADVPYVATMPDWSNRSAPRPRSSPTFTMAI
ncbi:hypothetical protein DY245_28000 [Streptomyces inhibens]|uniref:Uncharacterized protein n=1 Tax=Streptomyces inhibens TaxID=2293571 RepID=A0A371PXP4_STRIH|nr:hypothetical protein DY245_28000 [Streptomyces inhibens]